MNIQKAEKIQRYYDYSRLAVIIAVLAALIYATQF